MTDLVYLDNAATTPLDARVLESMLPHLGGRRGNPSSLHAFGGSAREGLEEARAGMASLIGASSGEIVFTSGGTESDDLAVLGLARFAGPDKRHAVVSCVEHAAVREAAKRLQSEGFEVSWIGVDEDGLDPAEFADLGAGHSPGRRRRASNEVGTSSPCSSSPNLRAKDVPSREASRPRAGSLSSLEHGLDAGAPATALRPQGIGACRAAGVSLSPIVSVDGRRTAE